MARQPETSGSPQGSRAMPARHGGVVTVEGRFSANARHFALTGSPVPAAFPSRRHNHHAVCPGHRSSPSAGADRGGSGGLISLAHECANRAGSDAKKISLTMSCASSSASAAAFLGAPTMLDNALGAECC